MHTFNLVDRPWIPCVLESTDLIEDMSLLECFEHAHEIREISDPSPLVTVALHRLLLAILHRNFGPEDWKAWQSLWNQHEFNMHVLRTYLGQWKSKFDIFDEHCPFYQSVNMDTGKPHPIADITHEMLSPHNDGTLFNHTLNSSLAPAATSRYLVTLHSFALAGLLGFAKGEEAHRSAKAGPLAGGAVFMVKSSNLFETLMLNLHQFNQEEPFESSCDDKPYWETGFPITPIDRYPCGYLDLLTWQSRRVILMKPKRESNDDQPVSDVVFMKGHQFPKDYSLAGKEPMLAFQRNEKAGDSQTGWTTIRFNEDRALWRDSAALFRSMEGKNSRPKILDWLGELVTFGVIPRRRLLQLDAAGFVTAKNKAQSVVFWRYERLPLPLPYLEDKDLGEELGAALKTAEGAGRALNDSIRYLAKLLLAPDADQPGGRQPDKEAVSQLAASLNPSRSYWGRLEVPFKELVVNLANDVSEDGGYGQTEVPQWTEKVCRMANESFRSVTNSLDGSGRSLKASAKAERFLYSRLAQLQHANSSTE